MPEGRHYIIIDLKSFYASCECAMPLTRNAGGGPSASPCRRH